jgi:hypothetical protein
LYLFVPATSAGPKRMFSKARRVLDGSVSSWRPNTLSF